MSFTFWFKATRPWALPASTMPVVLTVAYLFDVREIVADSINWQWLPLIFVAVLCYHLGLNMISDLNDFKSGVDTKDMLGYKSPLVKGEVGKRPWLKVAIGILAVGTAIGFFLAFKSGLTLLWIGGIGLITGCLYHLFKKYALGDLLIFTLFGVLITLGTTFVLTSVLWFAPVIIAIPVGLITAAILHANNTRDIAHDRKVGNLTQASVLGFRRAQRRYAILIFGAYLMVFLLLLGRTVPIMSVLVFLTFPMALKNVKTMYKATSENVEPIVFLDEATAKLQLIFTAVFSFGIVVPLFKSFYCLFFGSSCPID